MKKEINEAVKYICNFSCKYGKLDSNELEELENKLKDIIEKRYIGHWYERIPSKGQAYRCICVRDDSIDPIFEELIKQTGITLDKLGLPTGFTLFIDPGDVSVRFNESYTLSIAQFNVESNNTSSINIAPKLSTSSIDSTYSSPSSSSSLSDSGTHTPISSYYYNFDSSSERSDTPQSMYQQQLQLSQQPSQPPSPAPSTKTAGSSPSSYCGYVESYPYYYKLNRLYHALAIQKAQQDRFKKIIRTQKHTNNSNKSPSNCSNNNNTKHTPPQLIPQSFIRPQSMLLQIPQQTSTINTIDNNDSVNLVDQLQWIRGQEFIPKSKN